MIHLSNMSCAAVQFSHSANIISNCGEMNIIASPVLDGGDKIPDSVPPVQNNRRRRISSSALYEVHRKDLNDVCYLFVPDEYVSFVYTVVEEAVCYA